MGRGPDLDPPSHFLEVSPVKKFKKVVYYKEELVHKFKISNAIISKTTTIQNMP
jgi:hypothetical protein